jgi:hypothetical protein
VATLSPQKKYPGEFSSIPVTLPIVCWSEVQGCVRPGPETRTRRYTEQERFVSHKVGPSYAPALFARENTAAKLASKDQDRRKALEAAMNRLFEARKIKVENYGKPSPYNKIVEIVVPPEREG